MQFKGRHLGVLVYLILSCQLGHAHDSNLAAKLCEAKLNANKSWAGKQVVFDTNVLLNDPGVIFKFSGAEIIIPGVALEEVDNKKSDPRIGHAAREFSRQLEKLMTPGANFNQGVKLADGTLIKVDFGDYSSALEGKAFDLKKADNKMIALAVHLQRQGRNVVLVSNDINVRIKAAAAEVTTASSDIAGAQHAELEAVENYTVVKISNADFNTFRQTGRLPRPKELKINPNEFVMFETESQQGSIDTLARYVYDRETPGNSGLRRLRDFSDLKIQPKNIEQALLLELMMDPSVDLVMSDGVAGTGKTTVAIAAGATLVNTGVYEKIIGTRTLVQIGKETLGAMPGDMNQKLGHWYQNFTDAIEGLKQIDKDAKEAKAEPELGNQPNGETYRGHATMKRPKESRRQRRERRELEKEQAQANPRAGGLKLEQVPFPHLRGRNLLNLLMILDETQNASPHEVKTFLTRAGNGSKLVLLGDASQIDAPYLNASTNGLTDAIQKYLGYEDLSEEERSRFGYVRLSQGTRAPIVDLTVKVYGK
jgi:PhoH-like ATPase